MFNTTDEKFHAKLRRAVSNAYAMSTLVQFEPLVDSTSTEFLAQLARRYADREDDSGVCDFGSWLQYYAFDVIGELIYSKRLGFVDRGIDVDGIIASLEWLLDYVAVVSSAWDVLYLVSKYLTLSSLQRRLDRCLSWIAFSSRIPSVSGVAKLASSTPLRQSSYSQENVW